MLSRSWFAVVVWALLLGVLPVTLALPSAELVEPIVVVAATTFPGTNISFADLKSAFSGQPIKLRGTTLVPIQHPLATPLREQFDRCVLGLEPDAVGRYWVDMRIRDQGRPPAAASTPELALRVVATLPGAITYAVRSRVLATLKILTVDGKSAGDPDYALESTRH